ncbi:MAG: alpha/beta hydrolase [Acetobacteraceae bacterium]
MNQPLLPSTEDEHEFQYNPRRAFPHFHRYQAGRIEANNRARARTGVQLDLPYGEHPLHRVDIFPAKQTIRSLKSSVQIFFHGGYWRGQDKKNFAFVGDALATNGVTAVVANYELCPQATLDGVVTSALDAVAWTRQNISQFGADPTRISLCGHSAGAHLCAAVLANDWAKAGADPSWFRGAVLISGIYDPGPAMLTTVNAELHLTPELVQRYNMEAMPPQVTCGVSIFAGGQEPWRWIDQSFRYAHHLHRHGGDPEVHVVPAYDHFNMIDQFLISDSPVLRSALRHAV